MSESYSPGQLSEEYRAEEVRQELERIQNSQDVPERHRIHFVPVAVLPERYREGDFVYADGANWNPGNNEGLYVYKNSKWRFLGHFENQAKTVTTTVVSTTAETAIYSASIAANTRQTGDVLHLHLSGRYDTNLAGSGWTLKIKLGAGVLFQQPRLAAIVSSNTAWSADIYIILRSGNLATAVFQFRDDTLMNTQQSWAPFSFTVSSSNVLSATIQWGASHVNNSFKCELGFLDTVLGT